MIKPEVFTTRMIQPGANRDGSKILASNSFELSGRKQIPVFCRLCVYEAVRYLEICTEAVFMFTLDTVLLEDYGVDVTHIFVSVKCV